MRVKRQDEKLIGVLGRMSNNTTSVQDAVETEILEAIEGVLFSKTL